MSEIFTASNDVQVSLDVDNVLRIFTPDGKYEWMTTIQETALREFFLHEAGIWEDPETDEMFARLPVDDDDDDGRVIVSLLTWITYWENRCDGHPPARRYFAAHPEPKPWHNAQPGEVWLLAVGDADPVAWMCEEDSFGRHDRAININDLSITAGHRIWPEEDS